MTNKLNQSVFDRQGERCNSVCEQECNATRLYQVVWMKSIRAWKKYVDRPGKRCLWDVYFQASSKLGSLRIAGSTIRIMCLFTAATGQILWGMTARRFVGRSVLWSFVVLTLDCKVCDTRRNPRVSCARNWGCGMMNAGRWLSVIMCKDIMLFHRGELSVIIWSTTGQLHTIMFL